MPKAERTVGEIATFSAAPNRVIPPSLGLQAARPVGPLDVRSAAASGHCVDDLAFIHGVKVDNNNHGPAVYHTLTGNSFPAARRSAPGSLTGWAARTRICPGFIVMGDRRGATIGGAGVWGNGFLPAAYQGTLFRNGATPIVDLNPAPA